MFDRLLLSLSAGAVIGVCAAPATAQELGFSIGTEYSTGGSSDEELDAGDSDVWLAPLSLRLYGDLGSIGISTAYADISGSPGQTIRVGRREVELVPGEDGVSGFTDIVLSADRSFISDNPSLPGLTLSASVKLPTASEEDGLGSGSTDFSIRSEIWKPVGDAVPYAYVGARFRGESDVVESSDSLQAGVGAMFPVAESVSVSLGYDYRGAASEDAEDAHELFAMSSWSVTERASLSVYAYTGFTDATPDIGIGVSFSRRFAGF